MPAEQISTWLGTFPNLGGQSRFIRLLLKLNGAITAVLPKFKITMIMVFEAPDLQ